MRSIEFSAPSGQTISIVLFKRYSDIGIPAGVATEKANAKTTYSVNVPAGTVAGDYRILGFRPNGRVLVSQFVEIRGPGSGVATAYDIVLDDLTKNFTLDFSESIVDTIRRELRNTTIVLGAAETKVLGPCEESIKEIGGCQIEGTCETPIKTPSSAPPGTEEPVSDFDIGKVMRTSADPVKRIDLSGVVR
jgi:hypothetical protein